MFNIKNSILVKILLIFTIFLLCIIIFTTYILAYDYNFQDVSGYDFVLPDEYYNSNYHFLLAYFSNYSNGSTSCKFFVAFGDSPFYLEKLPGKTYSYYLKSDSSFYYVDKGSSNGSINQFENYLNIPFSDYHTVSSYNIYYSSDIDIIDFYASDGIRYEGNCDLSVKDGDVVLTPPPTIKKPYFVTKQEELESGNIEKLVISGGGYSDLDDVIYLQSMYYPENVSQEESFDSLFPRKEIILNGPSCFYYVGVNEESEYIYEIPRSDLGIDLVEGNKYAFHLGIRDENNLFERLARLDFTVGVVNPDDVTNDKLDQQTDAIKENTETQKGIWDTIKEVLSYINPFSENFFVYKLLELLFDGIKALIIPSDGFFEEYFNSLNNWFSDRFGFLYYPIELLIDILGRYSSLSSSNLSFTIPDIPEPFNDEVLIESTTFNFNSILSNSTYKQVHDYYLLFVDFIIAFGLIKLAIKKWEEVTSN